MQSSTFRAWSGWIVALITLVLSIYFYYHPKNPEFANLNIGLISFKNLVGVDEQVRQSDLSISYKGSPVKNLTYLKLQLSNTGTHPFESPDFIEGLKFLFPESKIINASLSPSGRFDFSNTENTISLSSRLLNPGESVVLEVLLDTPNSFTADKIQVQGRIKNISNLSILDLRSALTSNSFNLLGSLSSSTNNPYPLMYLSQKR